MAGCFALCMARLLGRANCARTEREPAEVTAGYPLHVAAYISQPARITRSRCDGFEFLACVPDCLPGAAEHGRRILAVPVQHLIERPARIGRGLFAPIQRADSAAALPAPSSAHNASMLAHTLPVIARKY